MVKKTGATPLSEEILPLRLVAECSIYPKYKCNICGEELWTRNSNGQELCFTEDGKRHYKSKCNLNGGNSTE